MPLLEILKSLDKPLIGFQKSLKKNILKLSGIESGGLEIVLFMTIPALIIR